MIIVSKGIGVLVPILFIASAFAGSKLFKDLDATLMFAIIFLFHGFLWFALGLKLNQPIEILNKKGEVVISRIRHSLFWIPLQYIGSTSFAIGVIFLINFFQK